METVFAKRCSEWERNVTCQISANSLLDWKSQRNMKKLCSRISSYVLGVQQHAESMLVVWTVPHESAIDDSYTSRQNEQKISICRRGAIREETASDRLVTKYTRLTFCLLTNCPTASVPAAKDAPLLHAHIIAHKIAANTAQYILVTERTQQQFSSEECDLICIS